MKQGFVRIANRIRQGIRRLLTIKSSAVNLRRVVPSLSKETRTHRVGHTNRRLKMAAQSRRNRRRAERAILRKLTERTRSILPPAQGHRREMFCSPIPGAWGMR